MQYEFLLHKGLLDSFLEELEQWDCEILEVHRALGGLLVSSDAFPQQLVEHPSVRSVQVYEPPEPQLPVYVMTLSNDEMNRPLGWQNGELRKYSDEGSLLDVRLPEPVDAVTQHWPLDKQYGLDRIDQRQLPLDNQYFYSPSSTGAGVRIYVIDTGVRLSHSQFTSSTTGNPRFIFGPAGGGTDVHDGEDIGHGTPVASIAMGESFGVSKGATLVSLAAAGVNAPMSEVAAYDWILSNHPSGVRGVVNMSYGRTDDLLASKEGIEALYAAGLVLVASAGNDGAEGASYPALYPEVISVGATNGDPEASVPWGGPVGTDHLASPSNYGSSVDLYAPAAQRAASRQGNFDSGITLPGTSFAAPLVSGIIACMLESDPSLTPSGAKAQLLSDATVGAVVGLPSGANLLAYRRPSGIDGESEASPAAWSGQAAYDPETGLFWYPIFADPWAQFGSSYVASLRAVDDPLRPFALGPRFNIETPVRFNDYLASEGIQPDHVPLAQAESVLLGPDGLLYVGFQQRVWGEVGVEDENWRPMRVYSQASTLEGVFNEPVREFGLSQWGHQNTDWLCWGKAIIFTDETRMVKILDVESGEVSLFCDLWGTAPEGFLIFDEVPNSTYENNPRGEGLSGGSSFRIAVSHKKERIYVSIPIYSTSTSISYVGVSVWDFSGRHCATFKTANPGLSYAIALSEDDTWLWVMDSVLISSGPSQGNSLYPARVYRMDAWSGEGLEAPLFENDAVNGRFAGMLFTERQPWGEIPTRMSGSKLSEAASFEESELL